MLRWLPNTLTLARLVLALVFPWLSSDWWLPAVALGALSDLVDGFLSRRLQAEGMAGRILDPIADKALVLAVVATLFMHGRVQLWELALIGLRDWAVLAGVLWAVASRGLASVKRMPPSVLGKLATAFQFAFLVALLIDVRLSRVVFVPTAFVSGLAAADYARRFLIWSADKPAA